MADLQYLDQIQSSDAGFLVSRDDLHAGKNYQNLEHQIYGLQA